MWLARRDMAHSRLHCLNHVSPLRLRHAMPQPPFGCSLGLRLCVPTGKSGRAGKEEKELRYTTAVENETLTSIAKCMDPPVDPRELLKLNCQPGRWPTIRLSSKLRRFSFLARSLLHITC